MDLPIVNKKTIIAFFLGLAVMGLIWGISASFSTSILPGGLPTIPADIQQKMNAARQASLGLSGAMNRPTTGMERTLPWTAAVNFIETAPVQKLELLSGLKIKLIMENGPTFTTTQPTKDAYLVPLKNAPSKIEVVK